MNEHLRRERLSKLADVIEAAPEHFAMSSVYDGNGIGDWFNPRTNRWCQVDPYECGTTACIAGWAVHLWGFDLDDGVRDYAAAAVELLGLDWSVASDLCNDWSLDAAGAAARLRELAAT